MKPFSPHRAGALLEPNDVIYMPGWSHCYRIVSAPFSRIHYLRWQGHLATAPTDPHGYVTYKVQALGGQRIDQLVLRAF
jgi:hypothetical protein